MDRDSEERKRENVEFWHTRTRRCLTPHHLFDKSISLIFNLSRLVEIRLRYYCIYFRNIFKSCRFLLSSSSSPSATWPESFHLLLLVRGAPSSHRYALRHRHTAHLTTPTTTTTTTTTHIELTLNFIYLIFMFSVRNSKKEETGERRWATNCVTPSTGHRIRVFVNRLET